EVPRLALEAKCSSPVEVLAPQGRRLFGARELGTGARQSEKRRTLGARQRKSGSRLRKTAFFQTDGYLVLKE
ncbi:hypothetical protein, partial [Parageobacillus toebii]|uniref:hypothetical protein n=1 Tax=Parageobacillus toebii TaxID=153151 RepID=UPI001C3FD4A8